jgi:hypothetical protein
MEWVPVPESFLATVVKYQVVVYAAVVGIGLGVWNRWFRRR